MESRHGVLQLSVLAMLQLASILCRCAAGALGISQNLALRCQVSIEGRQLCLLLAERILRRRVCEHSWFALL